MGKRLYKLRPDNSDYRDKLFSDEIEFSAAAVLPDHVDLRAKMTKVEDQGDLGSCTANAFAGNLEFLYRQKEPGFNASRLFIYYNERKLINEINEDSGANLRDGIKTLKSQGVCSELIWPYKIQRYKVTPNAHSYTDATKRKISKYLRVVTQADMLKCLANGFPFVFGISVYESFESDDVALTGIVPVPKADEELLGGHALCAVGYDQKSEMFIVRNSWGVHWGQKGYCLIPFEYMKHADDCWTIRS